MSEFAKKVVEIVKLIPEGKVASYGQIALYCGMPRSAREVGWTLKRTSENIPWWRVVNNQGRISIDGNFEADKPLQKKLLENEGIDISSDFTFDIETYRWIMPIADVKKLQLSDEYIEKIQTKFAQEKLL